MGLVIDIVKKPVQQFKIRRENNSLRFERGDENLFVSLVHFLFYWLVSSKY